MGRLLLLVIIGGLTYWLWKVTMSRYERMKNSLKNKTQPPPTKPTAGTLSELIQDPVCKLYIAKEMAISYKGHYFCSDKCKNEFREDI